jgi:hypothetical protein
MSKQLSERMTIAEYRSLTGQSKQGAVAVKQLSPLEELFLRQVRGCDVPEPESQWRFLHNRRFRFDFAWPKNKLALEIQGGYYSNGRHNRDPIADAKKANIAGLHGWTIIFAKPDDVRNGSALCWVREALAPQPAQPALCVDPGAGKGEIGHGTYK